MNLIKYTILSIISSITNILPISYPTHIYIYQNLFNTKIFNDSNIISILNICLLTTILYLYKKHIFKLISKITKSLIKKEKNEYTKYIKYLKSILLSSSLFTIIYYLIPHLPLILKKLHIYLFITALLIIFSINKKGYKKYYDITYKTAFIIGLSSILTLFPSISPLCALLFICSRCKINKQSSINYSFLCILPIITINSIPGFSFILKNNNYLLEYSISILLSTIFSVHTYKYLKYIYYQNKLYKISIYLIFLALFIIFWFR